MSKRSILSAVVSAALCIFGATQNVAAKDSAILIGIGEYPYMAKDNQLRAPVSDALAMRDYLISEKWFAEEDIVSLLNRKATADHIAFEILKAAKNSKPGDKVLIYFSGHGGRLKDRNGDEKDGFDELLFASDFGAPKDSMPNRKLPGILLDDWMAEVLKTLEGRDVTVIVDACHSATSTRGGALVDDEADILARGAMIPVASRGVSRNTTISAQEIVPFVESDSPTLKVWAAAAPEQYAWEARGRGIFTGLFLDGLKNRKADTNGNGIITSAELLDYTRSGAAAFCRKSRKCRDVGNGFTPDYEGSPDDVVLAYATGGATTQQQEESVPVIPQPAPTLTPAPEDTTQTETAPVPEPASLTLADLLGSGNDAGLSLSIDGGNQLKIGGRVRFEAKTNRSGTLVVFDVNPKGHLHQLSPSAISLENISQVSANEVIIIPEGLSRNGKPLAMNVVEPAGTGQLVALLIEGDNVDIEDLLGRNMTGEPIANARGLLASLAERLRRVQANDGVNSARAWSSTYLTYTISN